MLVHLDFVAVEFEFGAVKQGFVTCKSGDDLVDCLNEVDDVEHRSIRHCGSYIACNGVFESGTDV